MIENYCGEYKSLTRQRLREYLKAESAILAGQEYQIGDRMLRRPDLKYVQNMIESLLAQLSADNPSNGNKKRVVFIE